MRSNALFKKICRVLYERTRLAEHYVSASGLREYIECARRGGMGASGGIQEVRFSMFVPFIVIRYYASGLLVEASVRGSSIRCCDAVCSQGKPLRILKGLDLIYSSEITELTYLY